MLGYVSIGVPFNSVVIADIHCIYPRRDGQAELTWVGGYISQQRGHFSVSNPMPVMTQSKYMSVDYH